MKAYRFVGNLEQANKNRSEEQKLDHSTPYRVLAVYVGKPDRARIATIGLFSKDKGFVNLNELEKVIL